MSEDILKGPIGHPEHPLAIAGVDIRQDAQGRYCLNDLHRAAGGEKRHQPSDWLRLDQTKALIAEANSLIPATPGIPGVEQNQPLSVINGGSNPGTFVIKELVYAYAMWISPAFHLSAGAGGSMTQTIREARMDEAGDAMADFLDIKTALMWEECEEPSRNLVSKWNDATSISSKEEAGCHMSSFIENEDNWVYRYDPKEMAELVADWSKAICFANEEEAA